MTDIVALNLEPNHNGKLSHSIYCTYAYMPSIQATPKRKRITVSPNKKKKKTKPQVPTSDASGPSQRSNDARPSTLPDRKPKTNVEWTEYEDESVVKETVTVHMATTGDTKPFTEEHVVQIRSKLYTTFDTFVDPLEKDGMKENNTHKEKKKVRDDIAEIRVLIYVYSAPHPEIL